MVVCEAIVSGAVYLLAALVVGTLATAAYIVPQDQDSPTTNFLGGAALLLAGFLTSSLFALIIQGAKLSDGALPSIDILIRYVTRTQSGGLWLWREAYAALLLVLVLSFRNSAAGGMARWLFFLSLPLAASRALASHAAAVRDHTLIAVGADALHLIVAALWAGGLPVLGWMLWRARRDRGAPLGWAPAVKRFSRLALLSVGVLVLTGAYQSWIQLQSWNALFATAYGRVLLLKLALFAAMLALGAVNRFTTLPALLKAAAAEALPPKTVAKIGGEAMLAVVVFAATGFLTVLPPGAHSRHQFAGASTTTAPAGGAEIKILSPREGDVVRGDQVPIAFRIAGGQSGAHAHAYVDGELMGMFESQNGTLTGIAPGAHTLELRVVAADHQTELDASDKIRFVVK
jgi:putative copper export protein